MNNSFSFNRLWLLLKKDFVENSKMMFLGAFGLFGMLTLIYVLIPYWGFRNIVTPFFLTTGCGIAASLMFTQLRTKQGRISNFMLPATTFEKYLEQFLVYVVGFVLLFFACGYAAELVRCIVAPVIWGEMEGFLKLSEFNNPFAIMTAGIDSQREALEEVFYHDTLDFIEVRAWLLAFFVVGTLFSQALFALAATLWPKFSYLKMYVLTQVFSTVLTIVMVPIMAFLTKYYAQHLEDFVEMLLFDGCQWMYLAAYAVIAIVLFVASYVVYKRKDVC